MTTVAERAAAADLADAREDLTARLNAIITVLAGRDDVLLKTAWDVPPGTPPGWWDPASAEVTVNGDAALGAAHPDDVDPVTRAGRLRHPTLIGVAAHEAAHARVTRWRAGVPDGTPPIVVRVAALLEEPRAEGRQIVFRPGDRLYLRAAAAHLISIPPADPAGGAPNLSRWQAARAVTLLCGRAAAGVLDPEDVGAVASAAAGVLGDAAVQDLTGILGEAVTLPDGDTAALLDAARRWLRAAGLPDTGDCPDPAVTLGCGTGAAPGTEGDSSAPPSGGDGADTEAGRGETGTTAPVIACVTLALASIASAAAETAEDEAEAEEEADRAAAAKAAAAVADSAREAARRAEAAAAAGAVFLPGGHGRGGGYRGSPVTGSRPPTDAERAAANQLAGALRRARYRGRAVTRIASPVPPGRLAGRDALLADAQEHLGIPVTARPFRAKRRRHVDQPPLMIGIAVDVSGSMKWAPAVMASVAWIFARAAIQVRGRVAVVAFGNHVTPVITPGEAPRDVPILAARDGEESFTLAIRALDGALGLSTGAGGRLLVVVSDGVLVVPGEAVTGQQAITRLARAGTGILWLDHDGEARVMDGAIRVPLPSPAAAGAVIGRAAAAALAAA